MGLDLTPKAVATVLSNAGFKAAEMDDRNWRPVSEGFIAYLVPVTHEDRIGVSWHSGYGTDMNYVHVPEPHLAACATSLEAAGYQTEFVADRPAGYLVVWVEGDF